MTAVRDPSAPEGTAPVARRQPLRLRGPGLVGSSVVLLAVAALAHAMALAMLVPLLAMTALVLALFTFALSVDRDLFSPAALMGAVILAFYVARPIYIANEGWWGAGAQIDLMPLDALSTGYLTRSLRVAVLGTLSLLAGYATARVGSGLRRPRRAARPIVLRGARFRRALGVSIALTSLVFVLLVQRAGGPAGLLGALSRKSSFLQGGYWTTFLRLPLKACLFAWAAAAFSDPARQISPRSRRVLVLLVLGVAASDFLTGGRATLLVQTLLPVALIYHYGRRPIRLRTFTVLVVAGALLFVGVRVVTRDSQFNADRGISLSTQLQQSVLQFPATTVGGTDAVPFDSLMTLMAHEGDAPLGGSTYVSALNAPVPRALFPWKSDGGGNTWFTRSYYPRFYYPDRIETSLSLYGEAYANWRLAGIVVVPWLFGLGVGALYSAFRSRRSPSWLIGYAAAIGTVVLMLRGDAYQTTSSMLAVVVVAGLSTRLVRSRPDRVTTAGG